PARPALAASLKPAAGVTGPPPPSLASAHHADHAAGHARAGVAGGLALVVVRIGVDDHRAAGDVVGRAAAEGHPVQVRVDHGHAIGIAGEVVHVAAMVGAAAGAAVRSGGRVEVAAGAGGIHRAAVTLLVHMEAEAAVRRQAA